MKKTIIIDTYVRLEPPSFLRIYSRERYPAEVEIWASEFESWLRDHRSQDDIRLSVEHSVIAVCSFCGKEWVVDSEGPFCCNAAIEEWKNGRGM